MSGDDGGHDGKAESAPPAAAGAGRIGPVEALEDTPRLVGRHTRAAVAHLDACVVAHLVHAHRRLGPRRRVGAHVGQQVVDHLAQAVLVPRDLDRVGGPELDGPLGPDGAGRAHGLGGQGHEFDGSEVHGDTLIEPGQGEEVAHQPIHARRLGADAGHDTRQVLRVGRRAAVEELRIGGDGGDGCAQLVRSVRHELAQVIL